MVFFPEPKPCERSPVSQVAGVRLSSRLADLASGLAWFCLLGTACTARPAHFETSTSRPEPRPAEEDVFELEPLEVVQPDLTRFHRRLVERFFLGVQLADHGMVDSTLSASARRDGQEFFETVAHPLRTSENESVPRTIDYAFREPGKKLGLIEVEIRRPIAVKGDWSFQISQTEPLVIAEIERIGDGQ